VIDVPDRADVAMRLGASEFLFGHSVASFAVVSARLDESASGQLLSFVSVWSCQPKP
jgi:hypothetical protein